MAGHSRQRRRRGDTYYVDSRSFLPERGSAPLCPRPNRRNLRAATQGGIALLDVSGPSRDRRVPGANAAPGFPAGRIY